MSRPDFDQARFIAALTRHQPALAAFCHAQLANRQDAQEALQTHCLTPDCYHL
jgi:DNA-directed RNA polymerase specialized sigma24 family protein